MRTVRFGRPLTSPRVLHFLVSRGDILISRYGAGLPARGALNPKRPQGFVIRQSVPGGEPLRADR